MFWIKKVKVNLLCNIESYHAMLNWTQKTNSVKRLHLLQKKSLRMMFCHCRNSHTAPSFKGSKNNNSFNKTTLENCIFIIKSLKRLLASVFNSWFKFYAESHSYNFRWVNLVYLKIPSFRTNTCGRYSMIVNASFAWNQLQSCNQDFILHQLSTNKLKVTLIIFFGNRYEWQTLHMYLQLAIWEMFAVKNRILNCYTRNI